MKNVFYRVESLVTYYRNTIVIIIIPILFHIWCFSYFPICEKFNKI